MVLVSAKKVFKKISCLCTFKGLLLYLKKPVSVQGLKKEVFFDVKNSEARTRHFATFIGIAIGGVG
jgi:hypothetical protein